MIRFLLPAFFALSMLAWSGDQDCATPPGAAVTDGQVGATAHFTTGNGFITVTMQSTLADPLSAGQLLNGLAFTLSSGQMNGSLAPSAATIRTVAKGGVFSDAGSSVTGWALADDYNGGFGLCVLCNELGSAGPSHLIIGSPGLSGNYDSANRSIAGNRPHNPFLAGSVMFTINAPGVTTDSTITGAVFTFGTQAGITVGATCSGRPIRT
jgi:hypothetical protein